MNGFTFALGPSVYFFSESGFLLASYLYFIYLDMLYFIYENLDAQVRCSLSVSVFSYLSSSLPEGRKVLLVLVSLVAHLLQFCSTVSFLSLLCFS